MKIFCITGAPGSDLELVNNILSQANVLPPKPSRLDEKLTLAEWHQRVLAAASEDEAPLLSVQQPGRLWEQLASSIFLENMASPCWSWFDARSTWLLDFWREFEPNLHFLLVYTSPERALAQALTASGDRPDDVAALLATWQAHQQEILQFHHRHPQRTLLVDAAQCAAHPAALLAACTRHWKLKMPVPGSFPVVDRATSPLADWLAEQMRQTQPHLQALQQELEATLLPLGAVPRTLTLNAALADFSRLQASASQTPLLAGQIRAQREQMAVLETARQALAAEVARQQADNTDLAQENARLLQQNQHAQQELTLLQGEALMLRKENAARGKSIQELNEKRHAASLAMDSLQQQYDQLQQTATMQAILIAEIEPLREEREQLEHRLTAAQVGLKNEQEENALLLDQLQKMQADLEQSFLGQQNAEQANKAWEAQYRQQTETLARAEAALGAAQQQSHERETALKIQLLDQSVLDQVKAELHAANIGLKDAHKENELLLLQLHQVQGELEHYFLQCQSIQLQQRELEARWQRMLDRTPGYCDYQSIAVEADTPSDADDEQRLQWRISKLNTAGRTFAQLQFATRLHNDRLQFVFAAPDDDTTAALLRWPAPGESEVCIDVGTAGPAPAAASRHAPDEIDAAVMQRLAASDLDLLQVLCTILRNELEQGVRLPPDIDADALDAALAQFVQDLAQLPATLRFDRVSLKREQVNPDYEHLWLDLRNVRFNHQHHARFEFRLSCANVRPKRFGTHPKLEFPADGGRAPFDSWFDESCDDFGEKLELRFALPDAMDINVWQALSSHDQELMTQLIVQMPCMLEALQQEGRTLSRPWQDWLDMAQALQRIHAERTGAAFAPAAVSGAPTGPAAPATPAPPLASSGLPLNLPAKGKSLSAKPAHKSPVAHHAESIK